MAKLSGITATEMTWQEGSAPSTPASTKWKFYFKTDGLYYMDDAGAETGPLATGGGAALGDHGCRVTHSTTQSLASGTAVAFDTERWDTDAYHDTATNNSRITIPTGQGGKYLIVGNLGWDANATGYRALDIRLNGTTLIARQQLPSVSATVFTHEVSTIYNLAQTDYVELIVTQNSGGNRTVQQIANITPEFMVQRLA